VKAGSWPTALRGRDSRPLDPALLLAEVWTRTEHLDDPSYRGEAWRCIR